MIRLSGKLALLLFVSASILSPSAVLAEPVRVSNPQHYVSAFATTPDGRYAVYEGSVLGSGESSIYSVPTSGGTPKKLFDVTATVRGPHQIAGNSRYVVFTGVQDDSFGLYSVPVDGSGPPIQLNEELRYSGIDDFRITPDGTRVIYSVDREGLDREDLYSVPITGPASAAIKLTERADDDGNEVRIVAISPDSRRVVFRRTRGTVRLYSAPVSGPATAQVLISEYQSRSLVLQDARISPDSRRVIFRDDVDTAGVYEVYSAPLSGPTGARVKLNGPLAAGSMVLQFAVGADSKRVVYLAAQQQAGLFELYSAPLSGPASSAVKISQDLQGGIIDNKGFAISPDGERVVYGVNYQTNRPGALYSVPIGGPASVSALLHTANVSGGKIRKLAVSNDSRWVVYLSDDRSRSFPSLYSAPLLGPATSAVRLNGERTYVGGFHISEDSRYVVLETGFTGGSLFRSAYFYTTPIAGPSAAGTRLDVLFDDTPAIFQIIPGDQRMLYLQITPSFTPGIDPKRELFVTPLAQPAGGPTPGLEQRVYLPMLFR